MIITSWNCHNLNSSWNVKKRINRHDYQQILTDAVGQVPDVSFFCEVEAVEGEDACFHPCVELDADWAPMTSGISLRTGSGVKIEEKELKLLLPAPDGPGREYGMALRVKAAKGGETQEIVFFWSLKKKYVKGKKKIIHGYPATLQYLIESLNRADDDFRNSSAIIMGDFNMTAKEIQKKLKKLNTPMKLQWDRPSYFSGFPVTDLASGKALDHVICRDGQVRIMTEIMLKDNGRSFLGKGLSDHLPLIVRTC